MLTVLRKHRDNILIKIVLGLITLSFAAFWGVSSLSPSQQRVNAPAYVDGEPISPAKFGYLVNSQTEQVKSQFKDQLPPDFERGIQSNVMNTLINQKLISLELKKIGLVTTEDELADAIKTSPQFQRDGKFDFDYYQKRFLPGYRLSTGISYEVDTQQQLAMQKFFEQISNPIEPTEEELKDEAYIQSVTFKFDVITVPVRDASQVDKSETDTADLQKNAETLATDLLTKWKSNSAEVENIIKDKKLNRKETPELNYRKIKFVFGGKGSVENLKSVVSLTKDAPFVPAPLLEGNYYYIVKLVEKTEDASEEKQAELVKEIKSAYQEQLTGSLQGAYIKSLRDKAQISFAGE